MTRARSGQLATALESLKHVGRLITMRLTGSDGAGKQQVIPPEVPHEVMLVEPMFPVVVEFWGRPK